MARLRGRFLRLAALIASIGAVECLDLSGQQLTNITVSGSSSSVSTLSFAFYSDAALVSELSAADLAQETTLFLQNNALASIPATLFQAMDNVTYIDISTNPLTELEAQSFVDMPSLQKVICTNTQLQKLPTDLASDCPVLRVLAFNESGIRTIESQALVNLPQLEAIYLPKNNVSTLSADSFVNLSALNTLDLSFNRLQTIPKELLTASSSWKVLDFGHNLIPETPSGIHSAIVEGYISFDHNSFVEIDANAFAEASGIYELRLASNGIFTVNSKAFSGMTALQKLDLSDNAISVIDEDAFEGLDSLQELKLGANYIHRLTLSAVPTQLKRLELQDNLMDLMPDFPDDFSASHLAYLNLSRNFLWSLGSNDAFTPYTGLVVLDVSNNRLVSFTAEVFDPVVSTIEAIHFDYNLITSIPRTTFVSLIKKLLTNVTLVDNPGIGWTADVDMRSDCPNGSVFEEIDMSSSSSSLSANLSDLTLFGCIQCIAGTYHDNSTGTCVPCSDVSSRAFADEDGAVMCQYCPYSSDLLADRKQCIDFTCNVYCWLTLSMGIAVPGLIFGSKFLLFLIMKSSKRTRRIDIKEREDMNDWRMGLMLHQLGEPGSPHDSLLDDEEDEEEDLDASANAEMPFRIYDLPEETKDVVLTTLRDYFQIRKEKRWQGLPPEQQEATREWNDVEWETFHMHRILSRSFYGEVFLGDYCGTQVVVKRVMTLRFEVKELADTIKDVELVVALRHPNIVVCLGTMWSDPEHLCVISEYVKGGDLAAVLEVEALDRPNKNAVAVTPAPEPVDLESSEESTPTPTPTMVYGVSMSSLATRFRMALDVCEALAYVHEMGVSHSDLRSRNVLVTELFRCKLSDFRPNSRDDTHHATQVLLIAGPTTTQPSDSEEEDEVNMEGVRFLQPETKEAASPVGPTLPLVAPEVLQHNSRHLGADIYSVGILLLELWFHPFISFQNDRPNNEYEARRRKKRKLRVAIEGGGEEEGKTGKAEEALPRTASTVQKHKQHNAVMRHFMSKLRMLASIGGTDAEADECSFGTTPTSSAASLSLSLSLSSSTAIVDKLSAAIEDCLQSDPKKRPTAKKLAALFQLLLDEVRAA